MDLRSCSLGALIVLAGPGCYSGVEVDGGGGSETDTAAEVGGESSGGTASSGGDPPPSLECAEVGLQPLRRISSEQYSQIVSDLLPDPFGTQALALAGFPRTMIDNGFSTFASSNTVSTNESIRIEDNADAIAALFLENQAEFGPLLTPCLSAGFGDAEIDGCIDGFIDDFGTRAFRRPLTDGEREIIGGLYAGIRDADGAPLAFAAVLQYFLQAPGLLYVTERSAVDDGSGFAALPPDELAVRLGLLFLNGSPDADLLAAVEDGRLQTKADVEREARRLAERPEVARSLSTFHHEWMRGFALEDAEREHELWDEESSAALQEELRSFASWFISETDGRFTTLMTTTDYPTDGRLNAIYNAGAPDESVRSGLLTTAAAMASQAHSDATSLVERGAFIRNHVLCMPTPAFPGDVDIEGTLGGSADLPTARQRLEPLMIEPSCAGCHAGINPLGFPFEVYDWSGAYRSSENGTPIDTTVDLDLVVFEGNFANAGQLIESIAATDEARDCYATHWFRYALGRHETEADSCAVEQVTTAFADAEGDVRELLVAIAVSDAFRFRKIGVQE